MKHYEPHGYVAKLIAWLRANPEADIGTARAAEIMGCPSGSVTQIVAAAVDHALIVRTVRGNRAHFTAPKEPKFAANLWHDGALVLYGLEALEDGGWRVAAENVEALRAMLTGRPARSDA